jgi:maltooligosyltrehalose trehalohydrolase
MKRAHAMPFGAELKPDGATRFRIWAPAAKRVDIELDAHGKRSRIAMNLLEQGWHELVQPRVGAGARYRFVLENDLAVPDPASRFNPEDVHAPSEVVDPGAYAWRDAGWRGLPWEKAVLYELHVGTFTREGTFAAARARLKELADLGVSALELMPLADFPGRRNWGYDGVLLYAPDSSYGRPEDLKALVDDAHSLGLAVLLDVVYNHFGPEGNYLHAYAPQFFNPEGKTPWGAAIRFDGPDSRTVRDFYVHNALYWLDEYHFDGLRLDAVHAIRDPSTPGIIEEIARAIHHGPGRERPVHLVLENDRNEAHLLEREASGCPRIATAQWNDDVHHALHVVATGERDGYYADYADAPVAQLGRSLAEGFAFQGEPSPFRGGAPRGEPSAQLPPSAFVSYLQTHDQVGNRALGERMHSFADPARERAALACVLLAPQVPMLFMGEEYAASTPFLFFCDFAPELAVAVREGRRAEFARFAAFADPAGRERIPDPGAPATFEASKLRWDERDGGGHRERLELVRELIRCRRAHIVPRLAGAHASGLAEIVNGALRVAWAMGDGSRLRLTVNFQPAAALVPAEKGDIVWQSGVRVSPGNELTLDPGGVYVLLQHG